MERLIADTFAEPEDYRRLQEEPLVLHQRTPPTNNCKLVLFVHGLGGNRYGRHSTWGHFPQFLMEDFDYVDVGMYQYRTLTGRFNATKSVPLEEEARVFTDIVRDELSQYSDVVLIGHSMGGLLCKTLIHELVRRGDQNTLARLSGLILMATPQLGSLRVPRLFARLSQDAAALKPHGELISRINQTFEDHIALDENMLTLRKATIPTWSVEGINDMWVDSLSAGIGLPSSRRKVVRGSHTSIVKPAHKSADAYSWVKSRIETSLRRFVYDVFIAAAMASHNDNKEYEESRQAVFALIDVLKKDCGFTSIFYGGTDLDDINDFDPKALALGMDLWSMRASKYFILYYPKKAASSALFEAGWALVLGKPSIYVASPDSLPFLLKDAGQAFNDRRVQIFECSDTANMLKTFGRFGDRLFRFADER